MLPKKLCRMLSLLQILNLLSPVLLFWKSPAHISDLSYIHSISLALLHMFKVFEDYLRKWVDISDEEMELIRAAATERKLRKWQSILHEGEVWRITCFITSGCFRLYRFGQEGTDYTGIIKIKAFERTRKA
jgi:CRP-like cAMP-binding protein